MPKFGIYIEKDIPEAAGRKNQYYCIESDISAALALGQNLFDFERKIHTARTTFRKIHVWLPNATPRLNRDIPVSDPGMVPFAGAYNGPKQVVTINFGTDNGNSGYKDYRLALDNLQVTGQFLTGGMEDIITEAMQEYATVFAKLCTPSGEMFTSWSFDSKVDYRDLKKSWYNKSQS